MRTREELVQEWRAGPSGEHGDRFRAGLAYEVLLDIRDLLQGNGLVVRAQQAEERAAEAIERSGQDGQYRERIAIAVGDRWEREIKGGAFTYRERIVRWVLDAFEEVG